MSATIIHVDMPAASLSWLATAGLSHIEQTPLGASADGLTAIAALLAQTPSGEKLTKLAASTKTVIAEARRTAQDMLRDADEPTYP